MQDSGVTAVVVRLSYTAVAKFFEYRWYIHTSTFNIEWAFYRSSRGRAREGKCACNIPLDKLVCLFAMKFRRRLLAFSDKENIECVCCIGCTLLAFCCRTK